MSGTFTWLVMIAAVLVLILLIRMLLKWYWKTQTLPSNKLLFNKHFPLTYNEVFNDLSCVKTEWRNVYRMRDFSKAVIKLNDTDKLTFKGIFTSLKFSALVSYSRTMDRFFSENAKVLDGASGPQDEKIIAFYNQHKNEFEKFDDVFSAFMKKVTDVPKPVKVDTW